VLRGCMGRLLQTDWSGLFRPEMSLPEVLIRGTLVYVSLCLLLRVMLKRQAGQLSLSDLLVVAIVAGVCRNPLVRDAYSIPDGLAVVVVVLAWSYALDWLSYYSPWVHKLLHPQPVVLVRDGQVIEPNLRRELMTESQLRAQLRQHGVEDLSQVAQAVLEGGGQVSVIQKTDKPGRPPGPDGAAAEPHTNGRPRPPGEEGAGVRSSSARPNGCGKSSPGTSSRPPPTGT
jgi:uncharacterized membrane protein YcaP (DUF421 family)